MTRLAKLGAQATNRPECWVVMLAPTGQRFCVVRVQGSGFPKNANTLGLTVDSNFNVNTAKPVVSLTWAER